MNIAKELLSVNPSERFIKGSQPSNCGLGIVSVEDIWGHSRQSHDKRVAAFTGVNDHRVPTRLRLL